MSGAAVLASVAAIAAVLAWPAPKPAASVVRAGETVVPSPVVDPPSQGTYPGPGYSPELAAPTRDNPQSKLWRNDDAWWGLLVNQQTATVNLYELTADHAWRDTGTVVDTRADSTADALWDGRVLHIASRTPIGSILYERADYDPVRRAYTVQAGFPVTVAKGGTTSVALARDGRGRAWVTYVQGDLVYVAAATGSSGRTWIPPYVLPVPAARATADDQASITAFGQGLLAVMWSNQRTGTFQLMTRGSGDPLRIWSGLETPVRGEGMADGHAQLVPHNDGRLFAAVKTSRDDVVGASQDDPLVLLLERSVAGRWTTHLAGRVADTMTRPRLVLSESAGLAYLFVSSPSGGGRIFMKLSRLDRPGLGVGRGRVVLAASGAVLNDVTTTKQSVDPGSGLVIMASDGSGRRYHHAELPVTLNR